MNSKKREMLMCKNKIMENFQMETGSVNQIDGEIREE
jgi:hypothetical protein